MLGSEVGKTRQKQVLGEDVCVEMTNSVLSYRRSWVSKGEVPHRQWNCGSVTPAGAVRGGGLCWKRELRSLFKAQRCQTETESEPRK